MSAEMEMEKMYPLICEAIKDGGQFILIPKGNSMLPTIEPLKDKIVLTFTEEPKKNDIVLYRRKSGAFVAHRIIKIKNGNYTMCGDNQVYREKGIEKDCIIALINEIRKENGEIISRSEIRSPKRVLKIRARTFPRFLIYHIKCTLYPVYALFFKRR